MLFFLFNFFLLIIIICILISIVYGEDKLLLEENSICNSMIGNTYYLRENNLCDLPCFVKPQYDIPNTTYGDCKNNNDITNNRNVNHISFNENGFVIAWDFNNRTGIVKKTFKVNVYLYLYVEKTKNIS